MNASPEVKSLRILVVENHPDTLESLKLYLEDCGHVVTTAMTVAQAAALLPELPCDMLICDIGLPDGTGWDLMNQIRPPHRVFAIAMSGFGMNADSSRSRAAGFRHHLLKPFKAAELDRMLAEASSELSASKPE
jgi:two-component system CheB/CheR fusion protein